MKWLDRVPKSWRTEYGRGDAIQIEPRAREVLPGDPEVYEDIVPVVSDSYHAPKWRVRDRLTVGEIAEMIAAFKAGTAKHVLAAHYGINLKSVKQLLREHGVKKRSRYDIQA